MLSHLSQITVYDDLIHLYLLLVSFLTQKVNLKNKDQKKLFKGFLVHHCCNNQSIMHTARLNSDRFFSSQLKGDIKQQ